MPSTYNAAAPFWLAEGLSELGRGERDLVQLMRQVGKQPAQCVETVEVMQARSVERVLFDLSPDDPGPLLKAQREISAEKEQQDYPVIGVWYVKNEIDSIQATQKPGRERDRNGSISG